jgi:NAD+ kinase
VRIAILCKTSSERAVEAATGVADWLLERGHDVVMDDPLARSLGLDAGVPDRELAEGTDLAVVLGGDGTLLRAARALSQGQVPILGINLGRLGFLTDTDAEHMEEVLERVLDGDYSVEERMMLSAEVHRRGQVIGPREAFNDIVVNKGALAQVMRVETRVNDRFVSSYLADGIIVSTPTGSTAYGLAAGGPIVEPTTEVILVAPICPHILTNRPLIISDASVIDCIVTEARGEAFLTIDGQEGFPLEPGDRIRVVRSPNRARLVQCASADFFDILRRKMRWGGA